MSLVGMDKCNCSIGLIWGVSCNCPNVVPSEHEEDFSLNDPATSIGGSWVIDDPSHSDFTTSRGFAYYARSWHNIYGLSVRKDVLPVLWETSIPKSWNAYAAKVPTSYPGVRCEKYPTISSASDGGDGTWERDLGEILKIEEFEIPQDPDPPIMGIGPLNAFYFVLRSRAIYTDGIQTHVAYSHTGKWPSGTRSVGTTTLEGRCILPNPPLPTDQVFGDTFIFNIKNSGDRKEYPTKTLNHNILSPNNAGEETKMEGQFPFLQSPSYIKNVFDDDHLVNKQYPCNNIFIGTDYAGLSNYNPVVRYGYLKPWAISRIKLEDQRPKYDPSDPGTLGVLESGMFVFGTFCGGGGNPGPELGYYKAATEDLPEQMTDNDGNYLVTLFSVRAYRDSSVITEENLSDEPYVIAIHKDLFRTNSDPDLKTKIICSQWTSKRYRETETDRPVPDGGTIGRLGDFGGGNGYGDGTAIADGTLSDDEVSSAEVIMDSENPPTGYIDDPNAVFTNARIWCYNRVWDSIAKKNVNLALITTSPTGGNTNIFSGVITDFEPSISGFDPNYLSHGLPSGTAFKNYGTEFEENKWVATTTNPYSGSYCAETDISTANEGSAELSYGPFTVLEASDLKLWYRLDNREYVQRVEPFTELSNFPNIDNTLSIYINGSLVPCTIDGNTYPTSKIDNSITPEITSYDEFVYSTWRPVVINLEPGTYTIRISCKRTFAHDNLIAGIDNIVFPNILNGSEDNTIRWYYDGYQLRILKDFTWAIRDEEDGTNVSARASTIPHYITMDGLGKILIGNPHYIMRRNRDGTLDTDHGGSQGVGFNQSSGWVRFTASPNTIPETPTCTDPDGRSVLDLAFDPPWGSFQILPMAGTDSYQVRGANGSYQTDTIYDPIDKNLWTYIHPVTKQEVNETFKDFTLVSTDWPQRCHSWTISDNGTILEPHVEVLWRPTMHQPSWPGENITVSEGTISTINDTNIITISDSLSVSYSLKGKILKIIHNGLSKEYTIFSYDNGTHQVKVSGKFKPVPTIGDSYRIINNFPHPPYRSDFAQSDINTPWAPFSTRWRDASHIDETSDEINSGSVFCDTNVFGLDFIYINNGPRDMSLVGSRIKVIHSGTDLNDPSFHIPIATDYDIVGYTIDPQLFAGHVMSGTVSTTVSIQIDSHNTNNDCDPVHSNGPDINQYIKISSVEAGTTNEYHIIDAVEDPDDSSKWDVTIDGSFSPFPNTDDGITIVTHDYQIAQTERILSPFLIGGDKYLIFNLPPRWGNNSLIIPRTYCDAWSRIPQPAWVRNTSDGIMADGSEDESISHWDPDWDSTTIDALAALADESNPAPKGGPFGSAMWVMVQSRFNPVGARLISYNYNSSTELVCYEHGGDDFTHEDDEPAGKTTFSELQRITISSTFNGMTDFDIVDCPCSCTGCC